ncbi:DUF1565 domain-containing protein, partial [Myxococcota bacterium]|nr:DUF1565 domain-containing protein [Myxococcota bacterium]
MPPDTCLTQGVCAMAAPICLLGRWDCRYPGAFEALEEVSCDAADNNCDGVVDEGFDHQNDPNHCGRCANRCVFPNATSVCVEGICALGACRVGWIDLDGLPGNGCEEECAWLSEQDPPDPDHVDANCDGLDGDASRAIFVDVLQGADGNPGTRQAPLASISAGIERAAELGFDVYISHGNYRESLTLADGVSLYGGYDARNLWRRDHAVETTLMGGPRAVIAEGITRLTEIQQIHIISADNEAPGEGSYAVTLIDSQAVLISDSVIESGRGGDGIDGLNGDSGGDGLSGDDGADAQDSA